METNNSFGQDGFPAEFNNNSWRQLSGYLLLWDKKPVKNCSDFPCRKLVCDSQTCSFSFLVISVYIYRTPTRKMLKMRNKAQDRPLSASLLFTRFSKLYQISGLWVKGFTRPVFGTHFPLNSDEAGRLTPFRTFQTASFCLQWCNKNTSGEKERDRKGETPPRTDWEQE